MQGFNNNMVGKESVRRKKKRHIDFIIIKKHRLHGAHPSLKQKYIYAVAKALTLRVSLLLRLAALFL